MVQSKDISDFGFEEKDSYIIILTDDLDVCIYVCMYNDGIVDVRCCESRSTAVEYKLDWFQI
jgi:hypothetical protein